MTRALALVDTNQELLTEAARIRPDATRLERASEEATAEELTAYKLYTQRSEALSDAEDERSRSQEHVHWLRAAELRWLALPSHLRAGAYAAIKFHRLLAFQFLKLSDTRQLVDRLRSLEPKALPDEDWQVLFDLLRSARQLLLRFERAAMALDEEEVMTAFTAIEIVLSRCK